MNCSVSVRYWFSPHQLQIAPNLAFLRLPPPERDEIKHILSTRYKVIVVPSRQHCKFHFLTEEVTFREACGGGGGALVFPTHQEGSQNGKLAYHLVPPVTRMDVSHNSFAWIYCSKKFLRSFCCSHKDLVVKMSNVWSFDQLEVSLK